MNPRTHRPLWLAAVVVLLLGAAPAQAGLMQYTVEGRLTDDPYDTDVTPDAAFTFVYSLFTDAPYDPYFQRPRYRLHKASVAVPSVGFLGTWSEYDFLTGYEGHVWLDNDVQYEPPNVLDAYIVDFDVAHPAGEFRFEWNVQDDDAVMLSSDDLPLGGDFLAEGDRRYAVFTVELGQLGCTAEAQGRCYVYGTSDSVSFEYIPEPGTLALFAAGLVGLGALRRRRAA